jgi:hypothetical protein
MGKRNKPKRPVEGAGLSDVSMRLVEERAKFFPEARAAMIECATAFEQPETVQTFFRAGAAQRAKMWLALRDATRCVGEGRHCDLCDRVATRIRFVLIPPEAAFGVVKGLTAEEAYSIFAVFCDECLKLPQAERDRKLLAETARRQELRGLTGPSRRAAMIGQLVGEGTNLPRRRALETCERCGKSIWFDQDYLDSYGKFSGGVSYLCSKCAEPMFMEGALDVVPRELLGTVFPSSD